jgi:hypothetical protein
MPRNFEAQASAWSRGAIAQVHQGDEITLRPALFVLELEGRAAWIEPSYLDPMGAASPALHVAGVPVDTTPERASTTFFKADGDGWAVVLYEVGDDDPEEIRAALAVALGELEARGSDWATERARLAAEITA